MRSSTVNRVRVFLFAVVGVGAVVLFTLMDARQVQRDRRRPLSPITALPSGAALVLTADWRLLRNSSLGSALSGAERELSGLGPIGQLCGFDPSKQIEEVALAVAPKTDARNKASFGIAVMGNFESRSIVDCAKSVIARRSGVPARSERSSFVVIGDRQGLGNVAIRSGGPVLISDGDYLNAMIKTVEGHASHVGQDELHRLLRRELGAGAALQLSFILPPDWLKNFAEEGVWQQSPLRTVRAIAVRVDVEPNVKVNALIACVEATACRKVSQLLRGLGSNLGPLAVGKLGLVPEQVRISDDEHQIRLSLELTQDQATSFARRLLDWARTNEPDLGAMDSGAWPADELIRP